MKQKSKVKSLIKLTFISAAFVFLTVQVFQSFSLPKLNEHHPLCFFSNDLNVDVPLALHAMLKKADRITYSLYTLKDPMIQKRLKAKNATGRIHKKKNGLMHQKILCLNPYVLIGTMNMTPSSMLFDKNMIVGLFSPFFCEVIQQAIFSHFPSKLIEKFNDQTVELCFLPEDTNALHTIVERIGKATKTISIAMFYLSHPQICTAISKAYKHGIDVQLFLHTKTKEALELVNQGVPVRFQTKNHLMHLKWMLIDSQMLYVGSTNWTKRAFQLNDEAHLWIYPLDHLQQNQMQKIWAQLK